MTMGSLFEPSATTPQNQATLNLIEHATLDRSNPSPQNPTPKPQIPIPHPQAWNSQTPPI